MKQLPIYVKRKTEFTYNMINYFSENGYTVIDFIQDRYFSDIVEVVEELDTVYRFATEPDNTCLNKMLFQIVPTAYKVHRTQAERFDNEYYHIFNFYTKSLFGMPELSKVDYIFVSIDERDGRGIFGEKSKPDYHIIEDYATPLEPKTGNPNIKIVNDNTISVDGVEIVINPPDYTQFHISEDSILSIANQEPETSQELHDTATHPHNVSPIPENHIRIEGYDYNCKPSPEECFGVPCMVCNESEPNFRIIGGSILHILTSFGQHSLYPYRVLGQDSSNDWCLPITGKLMEIYKRENNIK